MSKAKVLLPLIFWAVLVGGASFGRQSNPARKQTAAISNEKSANGSRAGNNDTQAHGEKDQTTEYSSSDENRKNFGAVKAGSRKHRPAVSNAKLPQNWQLHSAKTPAGKHLQTEALQNAPGSHQTGPSLSFNGPGKTIRHSSLTVHPSTAALNGQQFKNARDAGARMVISGGSANSARGTAVINGSDIKRKP
jgi:hypothetical protein